MKMSKILLVEDNPRYASSAEQYLASRSQAVALARDYSQAMYRLRNPNFDGVITDCFFPETTDSGNIALGKELVGRMAKPDDALKERFKLIYGGDRAPKDYYSALMKAMEESEANQPLGLLVAERADELSLPFILATSTYHHDILTQPVHDYASVKGWTLVDCEPNRGDDKASPEFWERVFSELERKLR